MYMELQSYASDLLEDAMVMAQTKAVNSFSFRDMMNTLTELWGYCYERISAIDPGFYSGVLRLRDKLTRLPECVQNIAPNGVFSAVQPVGYSRKVYKESRNNDMTAPFVYRLSGRELYCWDADIRSVWVEYIPKPPFVTFTKNNRDPKIVWRPNIDKLEDEPVQFKYIPTLDTFDSSTLTYTKADTFNNTNYYKMYMLVGDPYASYFNPGDAPLYADVSDYSDVTVMDGEYATAENGRLIFRSRLHGASLPDRVLENGIIAPASPGRLEGNQIAATFWIKKEGWDITFFKFDPPYTFISYKNQITGKYESYIDKDILHDSVQGYQWRNRYNPFDFTGRDSNVEFVDAKFNDYTGLGVTIRDWNETEIVEHVEGKVVVREEKPVYKYLGFTPDTLMTYPTRAMYNYMVATLAQRFAAMNGSTIMAVDLALMQAQDEIDKWMKVNKSSFSTVENVNGPTICDFL